MEKDYKTRLINRKINKPNPILMKIGMWVVGLMNKGYKVNFTYDYDPKTIDDKPVILLSSHASRLEFIYTVYGFKRNDINVVCGFQNILKKGLYHLFIELGAISKYLYQPDFLALKNMLRVLKRGGAIGLFPEGIQSTSGSNHPINPATIDLLRISRLPVILCTSEGSYLTKTRYSKHKKKGKMTFRYQVLFTEEEVKTLSKEELYSRMLEKFAYNDFEANRRNRVKFKGKTPNIEGLDNIIYRCPICQKEFEMEVIGEEMTCHACGFTVKMNEYYDLLPVKGELPFEDIDQWYKWQRRVLHKEVQNPDFALEMKTDLYTISDHSLKWKRNNHVFLGKGTVRMDLHTLEVRDEQGEVLLHCDMKAVYSLTFTLAGELEFYYHNEYYVLSPKENPKQRIKWTIASEEIHNLGDPEWAKVSEDAYHYDA